ncbi:MAG: DNA-protecting protein DprA [Bacteroidetes bacterium]|nr:DNA-protecting protein DprA [Bacteroidota bacterium]
MNSPLLYNIAITLIPGVGDVNAKNLIAYCGSAEAVFKTKKAKLLKIPGVGEKLVTAITGQDVLGRAEKEIGFIEKYKINPLFYLDEDYPRRLKHCNDAPVMLFYKGNANLNAEKVVSIVGTRNVTDYGRDVCEKLVDELAPTGMLLVSGLALGVDVCAHRAALKRGLNTVGVLGHGLDRIYPGVNAQTAKKMTAQGGLLTEFLSGTNPDRENFPKRNRIIAGMSDAVIVIETRMQGGAMITAEIANSYNRDVFAVPGRLTDTWSDGCNWLVKTHKAALLQSAKDIRYIMGWEEKEKPKMQKQQKLFVDLTPEEKAIYDLLQSNGESSIDLLSSKSNLQISKVASALLNMEFEGVVKQLPGKMYKCI